MQAEDIRALSEIRLEHAEECLETAKKIMALGDYKSAANRSYYAIYHAMRAVLALDGIDKKRHSGIISEFRRMYIKTGVFDSKMSSIISNLFDIRTSSDYDDFFIIAKEDVEKQVEEAEVFVNSVKAYLARRLTEEG